MSYKNIYILGVGGSGMSSIAKYLKQKGDNVIGYDQRKSYVTNLLNQDGIKVVHTLDELHIRLTVFIFTQVLSQLNLIDLKIFTIKRTFCQDQSI